MTVIDRHISSMFVSSYLIVLAVFVGVYVFGDVVANLDDFTSDRSLSARQVLLNMVDYYGHNLPLYYQQLGGIALSLAASFTFALMLRNNEMIAVVASGVPLQRLAVPALGCSLVLVAAWMANSELVVPRFAQKIARQRSDLVRSGKIAVKCVRDDHNAILIADELTAHGILRGVYIVEPARPDVTRRIVRADAAQYDRTRQVWRLDRGGLQPIGSDATSADPLSGSVQWTPLAEYAFTLSPEEIRLRQSSQWADLANVAQMNRLLESQHLPNLPAIAKARDIRVTQPLMAWILTLLAMPFFLTREPGEVLVSAGKALVLCGACFAFVFLMHNMAAGPYMHVAVWAPVLVFGPIAVLRLANVRT